MAKKKKNIDPDVLDLAAKFLGKRVKPSECSTRNGRDRWQSCGAPTQKALYKRAYEQHVARRGRVVEITEPNYTNGVVAGLRIAWDDGSESKALAYMVEVVA